MQTADAGMAVKSAVGAMPVENLAETSNEFGKPLRRYGRVFNKSNGLSPATNAKKQRHGGPTQVPQGIALSGVEGGHCREKPVHTVEPALQLIDFGGNFALVIAGELHHQQGRGPTGDRLHRL